MLPVAESFHDLVVVGGGAGGLAAARAAARQGRRTALIQDGRLGGECTFTGCVPSKTLIEAVAQGRRFDDAIHTLHSVVNRIAATEDADTLRREGIEVIDGRARFAGLRTMSVSGRTVRAKRIVIATGSAPVVPPIPGLDHVGALTNDNVFDLTHLPRSIVILGGGAIGCELAQAFRRFGTQVHVVEAEGRILPRQDVEASRVVAERLTEEGVALHLATKLDSLQSSRPAPGLRALLSDGTSIEAERLLVAVGRRAVTDGLDLEAGGVDLDERGYIRTDRQLATSARGVYAVGDVTGRMLFTHAADEMGRIAVRNAFRRAGRSSFDASSIPSVTFTDPEVAQIGITEAAAPRGARVAFVPMTAVDRAITAGRTEGFVKLIAGPRPVLRNAGGGVLLGATIVGPRAGEMIHEAALAMRTGMFTGRLAQTVHAYPTWSTAIRLAAAQFFFEVDGRRARPPARVSAAS